MEEEEVFQDITAKMGHRLNIVNLYYDEEQEFFSNAVYESFKQAAECS